MPKSTGLISADYDIRVAEDQLTATVRIEPGGTIDAAQLIAQLTRAYIQGIDETAIVSAADELKKQADQSVDDKPANAPKPAGLTLIVARGRAPVQDVPEKLVKIDPPEPAEPPKNHYERVMIETVSAGDAIATIQPAVTGQDGVDVFGRAIPRRRFAQPIVPGEGAVRDGDLMRADRPGRVKIQGQRIRVSPRLDIAGDVCFATGNIRFDGAINIRGSVLDLFRVDSAADVIVGSTIEAAQVHADGDLTVHGGIAGKDKGEVAVRGEVSCRYISNARVHAGNDIRVHGEIANSHLVCGGKLAVENGPILSSHVLANGGVSCRTIGNEAFVKSIIEVGSDWALRNLAIDLVREIHRCLGEIRHANSTADAMLNELKRLNPEQRAKAGELLRTAATMNEALGRRLNQFRAAYSVSQARRSTDILVQQALYPGTTLRLPGLEAVVTQAFRGPLKLTVIGEKKKRIGVVDLSDDSVMPLKTYPIATDGMGELKQLLKIAA